jgi:hypothetical protein
MSTANKKRCDMVIEYKDIDGNLCKACIDINEIAILEKSINGVVFTLKSGFREEIQVQNEHEKERLFELMSGHMEAKKGIPILEPNKDWIPPVATPIYGVKPPAKPEYYEDIPTSGEGTA